MTEKFSKVADDYEAMIARKVSQGKLDTGIAADYLVKLDEWREVDRSKQKAVVTNE